MSAPDTGITRIAVDADGTHQLPRNHHGDRVAPQTPAGTSYRFCWTDPAGELVFAETADHLLGLWIHGYLEADPAERARMIAQHAVTVRAGLVAELIVQAESAGQTLTPDEEAIATADLHEMPDIATWAPPVPLVLLEGMYRPYTGRQAPISATDGDVRNPSNIWWLRNSTADSYIQSLAELGVIELSITNS